MTEHVVTVFGTPAGQGRISYNAQGRGYHSNAKKLKPWRAAVRAAAQVVIDQPLTGPVTLEATVTLARPASHFRTGKYAHVLRDDAPAVPYGNGTGDHDHYARAISDALTGVAYADDSQIVEGTVRKAYPGEGVDALNAPGAVIRITALAGAV